MAEPRTVPDEASITYVDTPAIDTVQPIQETKTWEFHDPHSHLTNEAVLNLYHNKLKPQANTWRKGNDSVDSAFYRSLKILWSAWYGTEWDFNGYTHKPRNGQIACGYFVSTTLRDAGMKLNRYELAKLYSHAIVTNICDTVTKDLNNLDSLVSYIASQPKDIYIVGLDSHVGFLIKEDAGIFFVHSNYIGPVAVTKELALESEALASSNRYVLGSILSNKGILEKWRKGQEIHIKKG